MYGCGHAQRRIFNICFDVIPPSPRRYGSEQDSWTLLATRLFPTTSGGDPLTHADLEGVVSRDADMIGTLVDIGVSPIDEHNTKLLDNVHPANWVDAEPDGVRDGTMVATRGCVIRGTV